MNSRTVTPRAVTLHTLGAWVIKCNPATTPIEPMVATGLVQRRWCVADNYRSRLLTAGQPVLFWVSGRRRGFWGAGRIVGPAAQADHRLRVDTDIALFDEPLTADEVRSIPDLADIEVFRSPQQANPSWVDSREWAALRPLLPAGAGTDRIQSPE